MTAAPFDVCAPLPGGVTVLEASAGTGKTFTIAALAARYVADGVPLDRMLLVTFTRIATSELRERIRDRLVTAERGLATALAGGELGPGDDVLLLLASGSQSTVETRRRRLAVALADFDAATITTTHGFCHQMLAGLGVAGDVEPDATLVEDVDDLVDEVVDDRFIARILGGSVPPFSRSDALLVARCALQNPRTPIAQADGDSESPARLRRRLAMTVREEVERRKRRTRVITYDDLLTRLADALRDDVSGPSARSRLRNRYEIVLIDEFQDTDELQWHIVSDVFRAPGRTLVLIGDPKQAIYAFRGADVYAYLEAVNAADNVGTLEMNWRSDQGLLDAYDALFRGTTLGHPQIAYRTVRAAAVHEQPGIDGAPCQSPLRIRVVHRADGDVNLTPQGYVSKASARTIIARDLAADVVRLLSADARLVHADGREREDRPEPLRPGHIAVLTRRHRDAATVRDALAEVGVPAVISGAGSVFATPVARDWVLLLEALERPTSPSRVRAAAITPFVGWSVAALDAADDAAWEEMHATFHEWATVLRQSGVAALLEAITRSTSLPGRVLSALDGERHLTDLRHVGQLLHIEATSEHLGITALATWLRQRVHEATEDTGTEERSRRLESDAEAVQVLTIHRSKGLEFPVVYYPYLWEPAWIPEDDRPVDFHDRASSDRRTIDVAGEGNRFRRHQQWHIEEQRGEDLRLAYVALTRAKHQAVMWWAGSYDSQHSALGRLLFAQDPDGSIPAHGRGTPADADAVARFEELAALAVGRITVERVTSEPPMRWIPPTTTAPLLAAATFDRTIDNSWWRTSYTALTSPSHEPQVASEPEQLALADEILPEDLAQAPLPATAVDEPRLRAVGLPLADMPGGVEQGSFIHAVLEDVDFAADDLSAALAEAITAQLARWPVALGDLDAVIRGLHAAIETPLGPLAGEASLRQLRRIDRLNELVFELPIAGGDRPSGEVSLPAIADVLVDHLPPDDPLRGYAARLRDPSLATNFRGYLSGTLDLVARLMNQQGDDRFIVVDYKTNLLAAGTEELSAWHYRPVALADAMQRAHYPLQALLYAVALHRYLRWRIAGYSPDRHFGGVFYLFLRGMTGTDAPRVGEDPCGVFAWRPPTRLIAALSDLLDAGEAS